MTESFESNKQTTLNIETSHHKLFDEAVKKVVQGAGEFVAYLNSDGDNGNVSLRESDEDDYEQGYVSWESDRPDSKTNKLAFCLSHSLKLYIATRELVRQEQILELSVKQSQMGQSIILQKPSAATAESVTINSVNNFSPEDADIANGLCNCPICTFNRAQAMSHELPSFAAVSQVSYALNNNKNQPPQVNAATNMLFSTVSYVMSLVSQEKLDEIWNRVKDMLFNQDKTEQQGPQPQETAQDPTKNTSSKIFSRYC